MIACAVLPDCDHPIRERTIVALQAISDKIELELDNPAEKAAALLVDLGNLKSADALHLGECIVQIIHEKCGQPVCVGLASGKFAARIAAHTGEPGVVNPVSHPVHFLAPVSISYLPAHTEMKRRLALLGLHTLGQFASLPAAAVLSQLGREGRHLQRLAQGEDTRPVIPYRLRETLTRSQQYDPAVNNRQIVEASLQALVAELGRSLSAANKTTRGLHLSLHLDSGQWVEQSRLLHEASLAMAAQAAFQQVLPDIPCGVREVVLTLTDIVPALPVQMELFPRLPAQAQRFETRISELAARYGRDPFYKAAVIDSRDLLLERRCRLERAG